MRMRICCVYAHLRRMCVRCVRCVCCVCCVCCVWCIRCALWLAYCNRILRGLHIACSVMRTSSCVRRHGYCVTCIAYCEMCTVCMAAMAGTVCKVCMCRSRYSLRMRRCGARMKYEAMRCDGMRCDGSRCDAFHCEAISSTQRCIVTDRPRVG